MNGQFDTFTQPALREGLNWITSSVTIDLEHAYLTATALGEIMILANRVGAHNVTLANPNPMMQKILSVTQLDRVLSVTSAGLGRKQYLKSA
jgi:anti-anti-sigma regulatory factor